ncbi:hypothetical protein BDV06DRAFT_226833 [Aspergillus oleicola]
MPAAPRWKAVSQFPITTKLRAVLPLKRTVSKPHIVSEKLCDDILQRVSPFLTRNAPVDILDLWPGAGIFSSKVNAFLKPRRHVLIEPEMKSFKSFLSALTKTSPSYSLHEEPINNLRDWQSLFRFLPEQGPSNTDSNGGLPRNDTLLVLAQFPEFRSAKNHFTGARWMSVFTEECLRQIGLHTYGSVRLLASMSSSDISSILPRQVTSRSRPSLLTEQVALHAFEVASTMDETRATWGSAKQWETLVGGLARVEQRASEKNVMVPVGREYPPVEKAPDSPLPARIPVPYYPRIKTPKHERLLQDIENADNADPNSPDYKQLLKQKSQAATRLKHDNKQVAIRANIVKRLNKIDDLNKSISRLAADPSTTLASLKSIVSQIESLRESAAKLESQNHFEVTRSVPQLTDDRRAAYHTGNYDDALLLFDRRPFEPLLIDEPELFPREDHRSIFYFEADTNPRVLARLKPLDEETYNLAFRFFTSFTLSLQVNNALTVAKLIEKFFPNLSTNDMVKAVPTLATYASKRPKPNFESLPKTLHPGLEAANSMAELDPVSCYQQNLDYDLSDVHCRILSAETLWDISIEYAKSGNNQSALQLNRLMGGSLTTAQTRESFREKIKKRW